MTDESTDEGAQAEEPPAAEEETVPAAESAPAATPAVDPNEAKNERLAKRFSLTSGEKLESGIMRPAILSFTSKYLVAIGVLVIHLLFWMYDFSDPDDGAPGWQVGINTFVDILGVSGFVLAMFLLAWFNRFLNVSTSGRWYTLSLLFMGILPLVIILDNGLSGGEVDGMAGFMFGILPDLYADPIIPLTWGGSSYLMLGIVWFALLMLMVEYYRRSFTYAISNRALIFKRDFMMSRSQRRILYDQISDINLEQGFFGTMFRFGNVIPLTASGLGLEDSGSGAVEAAAATAAVDVAAGDKKSNPVIKFLKIFIILATLQRKSRGVTQNPSICFFGIRSPQKAYDQISEQQAAHDPAQKMQELKDTMQQMVSQG